MSSSGYGRFMPLLLLTLAPVIGSATVAAAVPATTAPAVAAAVVNTTSSTVATAVSASLSKSQQDEIERLLQSLSLEQKIAQMIQGEIKHVSPADLRQYGLGSVLNGGGSFPASNKHSTVADWVALADAYHLASVDTSQGSAGIPVIWGTDAVHGHNNVIGATLYPHNIGLGAANDPALLKKIGEYTASEVAATGIDWIFAPTLAVVKDDRWGRTYEGYSDRHDIVTRYAGEIVEGMQSQGLIATAKHFIGDGGTFKGIDQGDARMSLKKLLREHGQGYVTALDAGVLTVMATFNSWNGDKIHGNRQLLTEVLKEDMGFQGFVVSDWNGIGQVEGCSNDSCPQAINAGIDMVMAPEDWKALYYNMIDEVKRGEISRSRIDDAVRRILRVKFLAGVMDAPKPSDRAATGQPQRIGHKNHRALAREAVRKSLVLLKNNGQLLPLKPDQHILVGGTGADNIGMQSGGWTISWQGTGNKNTDFPGATSIYQGLRDVVVAAGGKVSLAGSEDPDETPDVAIVVFGEQPYAEGQGDRQSLFDRNTFASDYLLLKNLQAQGLPVVAVFLTGRPLWVNRELNAADAFVVAWLPGTEGAGVADVLFTDKNGKVRFDFEGRLSFDWPARDLHRKDPSRPVRDKLFAYGYGLNYATAAADLAVLDDEPIGIEDSNDVYVFQRGTRLPWEVYVGDAGNWSLAVTGSSSRSANGVVRIRSKDFQVQEDSRQIIWQGEAGRVFWQSPEPMDFSAVSKAKNGALSLVLRVDQPLQGRADLGMQCGRSCKAELNMDKLFASLPLDKWLRVSVPLACFEAKGLQATIVNMPLVLAVDGNFQLTVAEIALLENPPEESVVDCDA